MLNRRLGSLCLGTGVTVVAVMPANGAWQAGPSFWAARGQLNRPRAVVALNDSQMLVQDLNPSGAARLVHIRIVEESGGTWNWKASAWEPPAEEAVSLVGGAGDRVFLAHRNGDVTAWRLRDGGEGMVLEPSRKQVNADLRQAAGLGSALPHTCAELPDASLVLGYDRGVLHVAPAGAPEGKGQAAWRWLAGRAPGADAQGSRARELMAAADGAGRILVLDLKGRKLVRIDPQTGALETLATETVWPRPDLVPEQAQAWGDTLFVAARHGGELPLRTLVVVAPAPEAAPGERGAYKAGLPFIGMDPEGAFAVTPAGHLVVAEPYARAVRLIRNAQAPGAGGLALPSAQVPGPARARTRPMPRAETPAKPVTEAERKAAEDAFARLQAEEAAEARQQNAKARRKAARKRRLDRDRSGPQATGTAVPGAGAKTSVVATGGRVADRSLAGPPPSPPEDAPFQLVGPRGGARPRPEPPPVRRERWIFPCGAVNQRDIATRTAAFASRGFAAGFEGWLARQGRPAPEEITVARLLEDPGAGPTWTPPATLPRGLGQFALSPQSLERTVRWMLLQAGRANPGGEHQVWLRSGALGHPGFSFGMYEQPGNGGRITLELLDLRGWARQIDGGGRLARELAASGGITGVGVRNGAVVFTHGLAVTLGEGNQSLYALRPGGATSLEAVRTQASVPVRSAAKFPPPVVAEPETRRSDPQVFPPPDSAPVELPKPVRRPSRLNPHAPEFRMPER